MRALVYRNNTLTLEKNYPRPDLQPGEALIRVLLAGICNTDLEITRGYLALWIFIRAAYIHGGDCFKHRKHPADP